MGYSLLSTWCHGGIPKDSTNRTGIAELQKAIQGPGSGQGLKKFALLLEHHVLLEGATWRQL